MTVRFCKVCTGWHDLDAAWPPECYGHAKVSIAVGSGGVQIIKDIDPYKTVAADVDGKPAKIGSRREHREFLKRNGYQEIGNELNKAVPKAPPMDLASGADIRRAIEQLRGSR